jgi:hypothetical protein
MDDSFEIEDFSLVDFDESTVDPIPEDPRNSELYFRMFKVEFNELTTSFYKVMRERKLNIITQDDDVEFDKSFKFDKMWDPFTGEVLGMDPCGPLCFHPVELVYYFTLKCLTDLWHEATDETAGYYEAHYGDLVGSGRDLFVRGRGNYSELYLFRLPITDCYLPKDCDLSLITMGPKLSLEEIRQLDSIASKYYEKLYKKRYGRSLPNLITIKEYYDVAIDATPSLKSLGYTQDDENLMSPEDLQFNRNKVNINAVNMLRSITGKN